MRTRGSASYAIQLTTQACVISVLSFRRAGNACSVLAMTKPVFLGTFASPYPAQLKFANIVLRSTHACFMQAKCNTVLRWASELTVMPNQENNNRGLFAPTNKQDDGQFRFDNKGCGSDRAAT